jgi:hypothetical protein
VNIPLPHSQPLLLLIQFCRCAHKSRHLMSGRQSLLQKMPIRAARSSKIC